MHAGVIDLKVIGSRQGQTGIVTNGPCDCVQITNVWMTDCDGGGLLLNPVEGFTRESTIRDCYILRCGHPKNAAISIMQRESTKRIDGTNNIRFRDCSVVYSYGDSIRVVSESTTEVVRGIYWSGGLIHGQGLRGKCYSLLSVGGNVKSVNFAPDRLVGPGIDKTVPAVTYAGKANPPECSGCWHSDGDNFGAVDMRNIRTEG